MLTQKSLLGSCFEHLTKEEVVWPNITQKGSLTSIFDAAGASSEVIG